MKPLCAGLLAALVLALVPAGASASCAASDVSWAGRAYAPTQVRADGGRVVGGATVPGCDDVVIINAQTGERMNPPAPDVAVELHAIAGVDPGVAVSIGGQAYVAKGFLPQAARVHTAPARCGRPWALRGTVAAAAAPGAPVALGRGRSLVVTAATLVRGLDRAGVPYLVAGTKLRAVVRTCDGQAVAARVTRG